MANITNGYEIDIPTAEAAKKDLEEILNDLKREIGNMQEIEKNVLHDKNWKGPNKDKFRKKFEAYQDFLQKLYNNGVEHLVALNDIIEQHIISES